MLHSRYAVRDGPLSRWRLDVYRNVNVNDRCSECIWSILDAEPEPKGRLVLNELIALLDRLKQIRSSETGNEKIGERLEALGLMDDVSKHLGLLVELAEKVDLEEDRTTANLAASVDGIYDGSMPEFGQLPVEAAAQEVNNAKLAAHHFSARYSLGKELAKGGVGVINQAFEKRLRRHLVVKRLIDQEQASRYVLEKFIEEAQITAQLEHPNIVPVHDMGTTSDGEVYFSMKYVGGESLKDVIKKLRKGDAATLDAFPRIRMLNLFQSVCMALAFAHDRGVIHRDIKPANIMIGDYGETIVLDWGVAKVLTRGSNEDETEPNVTTNRGQSQEETQMGLVTGTPAYMAPEQAAGRIDRLDQRTDIFALGILLYEILVFQSPFRKPNQRDTLRAVIVDAAPPFDSWQGAPPVPMKLAEICLKCIKKRPRERYQRVEDIVQDLLAYLEGVEDVDRRRRMSQSHFKAGLDAVRLFEDINQKVQAIQSDLREATWNTPTFAPLEQRRKLWSLDARRAALEVQAQKAFAESVGRLSEAVSLDQDNTDAAEELARLYWLKLKECESEGDMVSAIFYRDAVTRFDRGLFTERLKGEGTLIVQSNPIEASVFVAQVMEVDLRATPLPPVDIGRTPILHYSLREGNWLVTVSKPGYADLRYPIRIRRGETSEIDCTLLESQEVGEHYLHIPSGPCIVGGDPVCPSALVPTMVQVDNFMMARYPVTCAEYLAFLQAQDQIDPQATQRRVPRLSAKGGFLWQRNAERAFTLPKVDNRGFSWAPHFPVVGISFMDAIAFCEWYGKAMKLSVRLPTEYEWEKAARGTDERHYPWGDQFDALFCKTADSRIGAPALENVGSFAYDCSPYGVYDMAGLVSEYCGTDFSANDSRKVVRGGNYASQGSTESRATYRAAADRNTPSLRIGFRMACDFT